MEPKKKIYPEWSVGYTSDEKATPLKFFPATVPGATQLDIARAMKYGDYRQSDNYMLYKWMEDCYFIYRTRFHSPEISREEQVRFVSKGIDYRFEIKLNDKVIWSQEGMFTPVDIDITGEIQDENTLEIKIWPVPKKEGAEQDNRIQASDSVKPAVSYGWDWHPRLIPSGIWDETYLEISPKTILDDTLIEYRLSDNYEIVDIQVSATISSPAATIYEWRLYDYNGDEVLHTRGESYDHIIFSERLENPHLWWCHDQGVPYLYRSEITLFCKDSGELLDRKIQTVGFRRVRLIMNEGAWREPSGFPKGPSVAPAQIELNGRKIFAKGSNWVNPEIFPGTITEKRYEELLSLAIQAHFNMLRSWGGGIINKEAFFELCDRMGILVWQEFPLACNCYPDTSRYLKVLEQEATSIIRRLRKHACLAIWCGGNELFNNWSGMTSQSLPLRLLDSLCLRLDPETPFIPTSPMPGMGHGPYMLRWEGEEIYTLIEKAHCTAYTEFGIPGVSPRSVLETFIPREELFPPKPGTSWEWHHAFGAWEADLGTWLCPNLLNDYWGEAHSLDELIARSELLQSEGYKTIYEEARRQKPYCSMALNWCFNEPWPTAANNSIVAYPAIPKKAFEAVADSCRPLCASARLSKFTWFEGEYFEAELWILNDCVTDKESLKVTAELWAVDQKLSSLLWETGKVKSQTNIRGITLRQQLPAIETDKLHLRLSVENFPEYNSDYTLIYRRKSFTAFRTHVMNLTE